MGNGNFTAGKFNLTVSFINHSPSQAALESWHKSFELASKVLHTATLGQSQFGKISWRINGTETGSLDDIFIWDMDADDSTTRAVTSPATHAPYALPNNAYTRLFNVHQTYSFVITHEFGHLAFDLRDEYKGPYGQTVPSCRKTLTTFFACIMEFSRHEGAYIDSSGNEITAGKADQFCSYELTGHDTASNTPQQAAHPNQSCWDVISSLYPDIEKPNSADMPDSNPYVPIQWTALSSLQKHVYTMVGAANLQGSATGRAIRNNALFTANYLKGSGHHFGIVSANPEAKTIVPLGSVDQQNIDEITAKINEVNFEPSNQFVPAIELAASLHNEGIANAGRQAIIVASPGETGLGLQQNLLKNLAINHTFLHSSVLSKGPLSNDLDRKEAKPWSTHHVFEGEGESEDLTLGLQSAHIQLMFETDGHQLVGYKSGRLPSPDVDADAANAAPKDDVKVKIKQPIDTGPFANFETRSFGFDYPVLIEQGSRKANFLVSVIDSQSVELEIINPNGELVGQAQKVSAGHHNTKHYHWYTVKVPMPGCWIMRLRRTAEANPIAFRLLAYSEHPELHARFFATREGKTVKLIADVSKLGKLFNLEPPVVEIYRSRHHGTQLEDLLMKIVLDPRTTNEGEDGSPVEIADGTYLKEVQLDEFGSYTAVLRIANAGTAVQASNSDATIHGNLDDIGFGTPVPNFVRFKQIPIRVAE